MENDVDFGIKSPQTGRKSIKAQTPQQFEAVKDRIEHAKGVIIKVENSRRKTLSVENVGPDLVRDLQEMGALIADEHRYDLD